MVEVTDVNDLNDYIDVAKEVNATDLIDTFDKLRSGSYSHYWSFDKGLKGMNIADGCCSLGTIDGVNYCQPNYPQEDNGNGSSSEEGDTQSQGQGNGQGKK